MDYADLIDAEPAPRVITPTGRRYIAAQSTYFWCVLIVLFLVLPAILVTRFSSSASVYANLAFTLAAAVAAGWWAARKRGRLRKVLVDGTQRPARIRDVSQLVVRRSGFAVGRRVTIAIEVDGRRTTCVSWAGDLDDAEGGAWIRVLVHPEVPDLVVPVVSVT